MRATATAQEAYTLINSVADHPKLFFEDVLGAKLTEKQEEMAWSVINNRRTSVVGCNSSGKDYMTGRMVLWWPGLFTEAAVIVTGPSYRQVSDIVWREARKAHRGAVYKGGVGGIMYNTCRFEVSENRFALGFSTDREFNLQGFHSPHLLVIVTEAHAVDNTTYEELERLNPQRWILTGNAFSTTGEFYDSHHSKRDQYHTIDISAFDTPNVKAGKTVVAGMITIEDVEERKLRYGEESPMYKASILAQFPDNLDDALVTLMAAQEAVERELEPEGDGIIGVDVARYGDDATVVYKRRGPVARKLWKAYGKSTMETTGKIVEILQQDDTIKTVVVDDTGIGGAVTDRLRELELPNGVHVEPFVAGAKADNPTMFFNAVAEVWWGIREAFLKGNIDIEKDDALIGQITSRLYKLQSDRTIRLEPKDDYKKRSGYSPDEADALSLTYYPKTGANIRWL